MEKVRLPDDAKTEEETTDELNKTVKIKTIMGKIALVNNDDQNNTINKKEIRKTQRNQRTADREKTQSEKNNNALLKSLMKPQN